MDIRKHSSKFTIFVFTLSVDLGASAKVYLSQAGYDAYYFQDKETLFQRLHENPPHILVFTTSALKGVLSDFISEVQTINDDIKFIAVGSAEQFDFLVQYSTYGFVDLLLDDPRGLESRILWSVDRACEKIYYVYQNEQLFEDLNEIKSKVHSEEVKPENAEMQSDHEAPVSVSMRIADYRSAESKEEILNRFLHTLGDKFCLYFKYLHSLRSFVATHSHGISAQSIEGVGVQLEMEDLREIGSQISMGLLPSRFNLMLKEAFNLSPPKVLPLYCQNNLEGVFIFSGKMEAADSAALNEEFALMSVCYSNFSLERRVDQLEVQDNVTELFNRSYYLTKLEEEVSRSRRMKDPVSVIKLALDEYYELESSVGETVRDEMIKSIATVIRKTSRVNDVSCRTAQNEFALILTHCTKKGAVIRAERLRRIIEGTSFLDNGVKLSVSIGVSEYPGLCDSAASLDESSTKALHFIAEKGGNKICLFKAPDWHQPEFQVEAE